MDDENIDVDAIRNTVINAIWHGSKFLYLGVGEDRKLDIEQYGKVREVVKNLQHVLDNQ